MFESLFVAAVLGAGGPAAPPARPAATLPADIEVAFADTNLGVALASPPPANKDELVALARLRYDRVLKQDPTHKGALLAVARMHTRLGDHGNASAAFTRYLTVYPADAAGHHEAALAHARFGDWAAAVARAEEAVRLDSATRQYGTTLGFCLARAGRWDDAHTALCRVMPADEARETLNLVREHAALLARQQLPRPVAGIERFELPVRVRVEPPAPVAVAPAPREVATLTASYHLRNVAAADAAKAVGAALGADRGFRIDAATNQLVVSGSVSTHARVAAWLAELDRDVPQVVVQAMIAEVPVAFLADCGLTTAAGVPGCFSLKGRERELFAVAFRNYPGREVLSRPQIQVRDNQEGFVQVGQSVPAGTPVVPAGAADTPATGVSLRVTPRVMPEGKILLRVQPQVSRPAPAPVAARAGAAFPFNVQTVQTTVLVSDGETVVLVGPGTGSDEKATALLLVLTPSVVRTEQP